MALDYRSEYQRYKRYYTYLGPVLKNPIFRAYFTVVMSIFTVAIFVAFAIRPTIATIAGLTRQIEDKQGLNRRLDEKINSLSALQNDYQVAEKDLPLVFTALPTDPSVSQAIIFLEKTATASGINLSKVSVAKADYGKNSTVSAELVPVTLTFSGSFDSVKNFFKQVLNLPRLFSPAEIS
ncbi:MAG: type 4a pilus biogenesis protein PilO, partial [Patescibacteria group bacterium]